MIKVNIEYLKKWNSFSVHIDTYETNESEEFSRLSCAFVPGQIDQLRAYIEDLAGVTLDENSIASIKEKWTPQAIAAYEQRVAE